jgi:ribonuclease P protein component
MSWFLAPQSSAGVSATGPRIGLTAGKVLGKAHERNRIKRRMREALRRHMDLLPAGIDLIFHPRRQVLTMQFKKLEAEIVRILEQARAGEQAQAEAARGAQKPILHAAKPAL